MLSKNKIKYIHSLELKKSRKEEHPDECNYETVKKETRNESL